VLRRESLRCLFRILISYEAIEVFNLDIFVHLRYRSFGCEMVGIWILNFQELDRSNVQNLSVLFEPRGSEVEMLGNQKSPKACMY
jgi:hypothetical protein